MALGNLPDYPKKDNGLKFPVSGFTGTHSPEASSLSQIVPSEHTFAE